MIGAKTEIGISDYYLRKAMYMAFDGKCFYTGRTILFEDIHIDHILPKKLGGQDCIENYVLCCGYINLKKSDKSDKAFLKIVVQANRLLFVDKVILEYNNLLINSQMAESMININDFLKSLNLRQHSKRNAFVQSAKRNVRFIEYCPKTSLWKEQIKGASTKKRFYFDKLALNEFFKNFDFS